MTTLLARKAVRFLLILGGGALVALLLSAAQNVFNIALPGTDTSPLEVRLIVAPSIFNWVSEAADRFNAEGRRLDRRPVTLRVTAQDGVSVYRQISSSGLQPIPSAWIAEGTFTLELANLAARQGSGKDAFTAEGSVAQTVPIWGGFGDRIGALDTRLGGMSWSALHDASVAPNGWADLGGQPEWGYFKLVLPDPNKSGEGLAALLSAASEFQRKTDLTAADINDPRFQQWAQPLLDAANFANLGTEPGQKLAVLGPSVGDAGMLLESDWLNAAGGLTSRNWPQPVFRYAASAVVFDFPFAVWAGVEAGGDSSRRKAEQDAARLFYQYLLGEERQRRAGTFGLRTASGGAGDLFASWESLGIQTGLPSTSNVRASADAIVAALHWLDRAVR